MSKLTLYLFITTGSLIVFADIPIFFLFGIVFVGIRIELNKIEKKVYPIISNMLLSSIVGWATSFGVKFKFPELFVGDIRIFSMFITTLFAYLIILYLHQNETIQRLIDKYLNKKINNDNNSDS